MKEFKITKEQILELASKDESCKEKLEEIFPEVFEPRIDIEKMPLKCNGPKKLQGFILTELLRCKGEWMPEYSLINDTNENPLIWVSGSADFFPLTPLYKWKVIEEDGFQQLTFE